MPLNFSNAMCMGIVSWIRKNTFVQTYKKINMFIWKLMDGFDQKPLCRKRTICNSADQ